MDLESGIRNIQILISSLRWVLSVMMEIESNEMYGGAGAVVQGQLRDAGPPAVVAAAAGSGGGVKRKKRGGRGKCK
jgi:hypothetical protein